MVSYKLPLKCVKQGNDWIFEWSNIRDIIGNISTLGINEYSPEIHFVGWPGITPKTLNEREKLEDDLDLINCHPVFLDEDQIYSFHDIFCRQTLWPLFHYYLPTRHDSIVKHSLNYENYYNEYVNVNNIYAKKASIQYDDDCLIWFHDYHLLLAPHFLRRIVPNAQIGLFLHTTFPTSEVFRTLPSRKEILNGMLSCDLLGFHTYDYARHFLSSVKRVLGLDFYVLPYIGTLYVKYFGRDVSLRIGHVSCLSQKIKHKSLSNKVKEYKKNYWLKKYQNKQIILAHGELDIVRGTLLIIEAFDRFLTNYPNYVEKVALILVISTLQEDVNENKIVKLNLDNNGRYYKTDSNIKNERCKQLLTSIKLPIEKKAEQMKLKYNNENIIELLHSNNSWSNDDEYSKLLSLYQCVDLALFSTFWDGFSTLPYEFVAANDISTHTSVIESNNSHNINGNNIDQPKYAPIILSEFMGCNRSLNAISVNPWDVTKVACAINDALMVSNEDKKRHHILRCNHVMNYTFETWAQGFLNDLLSAAKRTNKYTQTTQTLTIGFGTNSRLIYLPKNLTDLFNSTKLLTQCFKNASYRILLFDYGGTLTDINERETFNKTKTTNDLKNNNDNGLSSVDNETNDTSNKEFTYDNRPLSSINSQNRLNDAEQNSGKISKNTLKYLNHLASDSNTTVAIISGQTRRVLNKEFKDRLGNILLCAEKGAYFKYPNSDEWKLNETIKNDFDKLSDWKRVVEKILNTYTERTAGSYIQKKDTAFAWHYHDCDPNYGDMQAEELERYLKRLLGNGVTNVIIQKYDHARILEILPRNINKGATTLKIIDSIITMKMKDVSKNFQTNDLFLLCVGNDKSDEKMFQACELASKTIKTEYNFSITIGRKPTNAKFYISQQSKMLDLLALLKNALITNNNDNNNNNDIKNDNNIEINTKDITFTSNYDNDFDVSNVITNEIDYSDIKYDITNNTFDDFNHNNTIDNYEEFSSNEDSSFDNPGPFFKSNSFSNFKDLKKKNNTNNNNNINSINTSHKRPYQYIKMPMNNENRALLGTPLHTIHDESPHMKTVPETK